jgi:hypothetical protein
MRFSPAEIEYSSLQDNHCLQSLRDGGICWGAIGPDDFLMDVAAAVSDRNVVGAAESLGQAQRILAVCSEEQTAAGGRRRT